MNARNSVLCLLIILSSSIYATDATKQTSEDISVQQSIANSKSIDELIEKMNRAKREDRYIYMNAIKKRISSAKKEEREEKIKSVLEKLNREKSNRLSDIKNRESMEPNNPIDNTNNPGGMGKDMGNAIGGGMDMGGTGGMGGFGGKGGSRGGGMF